MKKVEIIDGKIWCPKCSQHKNIDNFYFFKGSPKRPCKDCKINYQNQFYQENQKDIEIYRKNYYQENRDDIITNQLIRDGYRKDVIAEYQVEYRKTNKTELQNKKRTYKKIRRQNDPSFKLRGVVSNSIFQALKYIGSSKGGKSIFQFLPYTMEELRDHLEKQFESWMTWDNWGAYDRNVWNDKDTSTWTWHIDHIIPQSKLLYSSMTDENFQKCWALENLRPYSAKQNVIDGIRKNK